MKFQPFVLIFFLLAGICPAASFCQVVPAVDLSNGVIHARIYLPDTGVGYYRGTRFDWSGVMPELTWKGHSYCGVWFDNYNPRTHDAIMGPVESFSPLGYQKATAQGTFVAVGIGVLEKPDTAAYSPFQYYSIRDAGHWAIKSRKSSVRFTHTLKDKSYPYRYSKEIILEKGQPVITILHAFINRGRDTVTLEVYDHNLFVYDQIPTGPAYSTHFNFQPAVIQGGDRGFGESGIVTVKDSAIKFNRMPRKGESVYGLLTGYSKTGPGYSMRVENNTSGAAMEITGDQPLSKMVFWGSARMFSPEPYITMVAPPGKAVKWTLRYRLYEVEKKLQ